MSQFISVEVSASTICDTMNEDPNFAFEVIDEIANRLNMGAMKDDMCDIIGGIDAVQAEHLAHEFEEFGQAIRLAHQTRN